MLNYGTLLASSGSSGTCRISHMLSSHPFRLNVVCCTDLSSTQTERGEGLVRLQGFCELFSAEQGGYDSCDI